MSQTTTSTQRPTPTIQHPISARESKFDEGPVARRIEEQTARLPSDVFLWTAGGAAVASLGLMLAGRRHDAMFIGQWVPSILICGLYNKLVKTTGHDRRS